MPTVGGDRGGATVGTPDAIFINQGWAEQVPTMFVPGGLMVVNAGSSAMIAANDITGVRFRVQRPALLTGLRWTQGATQNGNYDLGIYVGPSAPQASLPFSVTALYRKGQTAAPAAFTVTTEAPNVQCLPGLDYWWCWGTDSATETIMAGTFPSGIAQAGTLAEDGNIPIGRATTYAGGLPASLSFTLVGSLLPIAYLSFAGTPGGYP